MEVNLPADLFIEDSTFALEPRLDSNGNKSVRDYDAWPQPSLITSIDGLLRIPNLTNTTRVLKKNEHFCQIREVFVPDIVANNLHTHVISQAVHTQSREVHTGHSASVQIDPESKLYPEERASFRSILDEYDEVFDPNYAGYNGHVGPFEALFNHLNGKATYHNTLVISLLNYKRSLTNWRQWVYLSDLKMCQ